MKTSYRLFLLSVLCLSMAASLNAQETTAYVIDKNIKYQEIDNFSASDAWRMDFVGKNWPVEKKEHIADLLFKHEFDKDGNQLFFYTEDNKPIFDVDRSSQLKALELLGRYRSLFVDKSTTSVDLTTDFEKYISAAQDDKEW